ncbi:hypothetical protein C8R43DRAFT_1122422 [Mycena crocata]|nr:hypothetical protein C8R43DRAFT_1122422 [Mycena crocata]
MDSSQLNIYRVRVSPAHFISSAGLEHLPTPAKAMPLISVPAIILSVAMGDTPLEMANGAQTGPVPSTSAKVTDSDCDTEYDSDSPIIVDDWVASSQSSEDRGCWQDEMEITDTDEEDLAIAHRESREYREDGACALLYFSGKQLGCIVSFFRRGSLELSGPLFRSSALFISMREQLRVFWGSFPSLARLSNSASLGRSSSYFGRRSPGSSASSSVIRPSSARPSSFVSTHQLVLIPPQLVGISKQLSINLALCRPRMRAAPLPALAARLKLGSSFEPLLPGCVSRAHSSSAASSARPSSASRALSSSAYVSSPTSPASSSSPCPSTSTSSFRSSTFASRARSSASSPFPSASSNVRPSPSCIGSSIGRFIFCITLFISVGASLFVSVTFEQLRVGIPLCIEHARVPHRRRVLAQRSPRLFARVVHTAALRLFLALAARLLEQAAQFRRQLSDPLHRHAPAAQRRFVVRAAPLRAPSAPSSSSLILCDPLVIVIAGTPELFRVVDSREQFSVGSLFDGLVDPLLIICAPMPKQLRVFSSFLVGAHQQLHLACSSVSSVCSSSARTSSSASPSLSASLSARPSSSSARAAPLLHPLSLAPHRRIRPHRCIQVSCLLDTPKQLRYCFSCKLLVGSLLVVRTTQLRFLEPPRRQFAPLLRLAIRIVVIDRPPFIRFRGVLELTCFQRGVGVGVWPRLMQRPSSETLEAPTSPHGSIQQVQSSTLGLDRRRPLRNLVLNNASV